MNRDTWRIVGSDIENVAAVSADVLAPMESHDLPPYYKASPTRIAAPPGSPEHTAGSLRIGESGAGKRRARRVRASPDLETYEPATSSHAHCGSREHVRRGSSRRT